ncbi:MAG: hypothetical protein ACXVZ4_10635 [Gaiellaceae bacterium]
MHRRHVTVISLFLAAALVLGMFATLRTTQLGAGSAAPRLTAAQIAQRNRQLDRVEASLRKATRQKPPALPALPAAPTRLAAAAAPQRVVYVRPKPIVHVVHRSGEHENDGGHEHDGGGFDD